MPSWAGPVVGRCFLLLLLVGDWVWDTRFGNDLFSQRMSSSLALRTIGPAHQIISQIASAPRTPFAPAVRAEVVGQSLATIEATANEPILSGTSLVYVFMSIQR
jgi:hypothetical protein